MFIKEVLLFLLAFLDSEFTKRRISEFGVEVELNPLIRGLVKGIGIYGVDVGVCIPTTIIGILGLKYPNLLTFALGVRSCLFLLQWRSMYGK